MKIVLNVLPAFVAFWGVAALAGFLIGLKGILQDGFRDPFVTAGTLLLLLCVGLFAALSLYAAFSFWKHWNKQAAERVLSLSAFYIWVTFMLIYPGDGYGSSFQQDPDRFPVETFLVLASVPITFLLYRFLQERTRAYFTEVKADQGEVVNCE